MHALASCAHFMCMHVRNITFEPIELQTSFSLNRVFGVLNPSKPLPEAKRASVHLGDTVGSRQKCAQPFWL